MGIQAKKVKQLREEVNGTAITILPCAHDALSVKLIEQSGFPATFMSGFGVSASRLGLPDTGLISYGEMLDQGRSICEACSIPVFGDADTGYGNPLNIQRTVRGYMNAGFAGIMIEDQVTPKRCGHTTGKEVIERTLAVNRIKSAIDARTQAQDEAEDEDIIIIARTDARASMEMDEALRRGQEFQAAGADIVFIEAPKTIDELQLITKEISCPKMVNIIDYGVTPQLSPLAFEEMGFQLAAYPLMLLSASICSMQDKLSSLKNMTPDVTPMPFETLQSLLGFDTYDQNLNRLTSK